MTSDDFELEGIANLHTDVVRAFKSSKDGKADIVDSFLHDHAIDLDRKDLVRTWAIMHGDIMAGFFSLSATQEVISELPANGHALLASDGYNFEYASEDAARDHRKNIIPGVYINYFGVAVAYQGKKLSDGVTKISDVVLREALDRALQAAAVVGVAIVSLDALRTTQSRGVVSFYEKYRFVLGRNVSEKSSTWPMFILTQTLKQALPEQPKQVFVQ
jgi:hypothetical protein